MEHPSGTTSKMIYHNLDNDLSLALMLTALLARYEGFSRAVTMLAQRDADKKGSPSAESQATPSTVSSRGSDRSNRLFVSPSREDVYVSATPGALHGRQSEARRRWRGEGAVSETVEPLRRQIEDLKVENRHLTESLAEQKHRIEELVDLHDAESERAESRIEQLERDVLLYQEQLQTAAYEQRQIMEENDLNMADTARKHHESLASLERTHGIQVRDLQDSLMREQAAHESEIARLHEAHQKDCAELRAAISNANQLFTPSKPTTSVTQNDYQSDTPYNIPRPVLETPVLSRPSTLLDELAAASAGQGTDHREHNNPALGLGLGVFANCSYLSDVELVLGPEQELYKAHRIILAAHTAGIFHAQANPICISTFSATTLKHVLAWMYGGVLPSCASDLARVHECASSIGLASCAGDCLANIGKMSIQEAVNIYDETTSYDIRSACVQALAKNCGKGAAPVSVLQLASRHGMLRHIDRATLHVDYLGWCLDVAPRQ